MSTGRQWALEKGAVLKLPSPLAFLSVFFLFFPPLLLREIVLTCHLSYSLACSRTPSFPYGSDGKEFACNMGDLGLIPELGRSPGGGHGNPLQYSCLENSMDKRAWWAADHRGSKSWTQLSNQAWHRAQAQFTQILFAFLCCCCFIF